MVPRPRRRPPFSRRLLIPLFLVGSLAMVSGCLDNGPKISVTRPTVSMEDGMKLAVDVILYASDLEAMETKVRAAGGTVTVPIFAFPGGRRFHFQDPAGNELAVWSES